MNNITIIGGGTAGWLSALFINKKLPDVNLTLIESKSIGIVGVGEGTVPSIRRFLSRLGISEFDFMNKTNATKKIGISFENWANDGTTFNHDFFQDGADSYAYHFDTQAIGNYFKDIGLTRNITHIEDNVIGFEKDGDIIKTIHLENNDSIDTDFVIDCSGFAKLVVGNELGGEWTSHKKHLTLNSAVPFHLPLDGEVFTADSDTRTNAITMKYGWMWMIPLQNRWGCGYVFDDKYINEDDARKEVEEYFDKKITFSKKIQFESGYFKDVWVGNSIAIGLSGGFFEPLEATSIMTVIYQLNKLNQFIKNDESGSYNITEYNSLIRNFNEQVFYFIKYHYVCDRVDTKFWQDYKNKPIPDKLKQLLTDDYRLKIFDNNKLKEILEISDKEPEPVFSTNQYSILSIGNFKKTIKSLF